MKKNDSFCAWGLLRWAQLCPNGLPLGGWACGSPGLASITLRFMQDLAQDIGLVGPVPSHEVPCDRIEECSDPMHFRCHR